MSKSYKKFFITILIIAFPLILLLCLSGTAGIPGLFLHVKTALSLSFVVLALYVLYRRRSFDLLSLFCTVGLLFGMLGDIFLELAGAVENVGVLSGILMFLVQHIVWCSGMLLSAKGSDRRKKLLITLPLSLIGVFLFIIALTALVGASLGDMTVPVFIYGTALTWAFAIPLTIRQKKDLRYLTLAIAGILFFTSDAILVKGLFGDGLPAVMSAVNLLTYYYAQYLIALSTGIETVKGE